MKWNTLRQVGAAGALAASIALAAADVASARYQGMSCSQPWYERNRIFAQQGYCFSSRRAIATFGRRCYAPYGRLTGWQRREIARIRYYERRYGC